MALLRPSPWDPSSIKADGSRDGERGAAKGRKVGIFELSSEASGPWKGLPMAGLLRADLWLGIFWMELHAPVSEMRGSQS